MVGGSILLLRSKESADQSAALLAQGSFACLSLLNAYSTIVDGMAVFAEACGAARRVAELLDRQGILPTEKPLPSKAGRPNLEEKGQSSADEGVAIAMTPIRRYVCKEDIAATVFQPLMAGATDFTAGEAAVSEPLQHVFLGTGSSTSPGKQRLLLRTESLHVRSPSGKILIASMSLDIREGMRVLVRGPSGCGKSTLLKVRYNIHSRLLIASNMLSSTMPPSRWLACCLCRPVVGCRCSWRVGLAYTAIRPAWQ